MSADEEKGGPTEEDKKRLADTNMENYGSKEHRDLKKEAAESEKAWKGAGEKAGLEIWRIEKFQVVRWPKKKYGKFHTGDSYIILQTIENDEGKDYNVYFWLGAETSQDEAGTAAYKTVELDDLLGDEPVQYREVQGNETPDFLKLFEKMSILPGGVASGFRKVEDEVWKPNLLMVTGDRKNMQEYDVTSQGVKALNNHDVFILDMKDNIYVFHGAGASAWEKRRANQTVQNIKGEPGRGKSQDVHIDGLEDDSEEYKEFWDFFGGKPEELPEEEEDMTPDIEMCMIKISDDHGKLQCKKVMEGGLDSAKLETDDVFIIDTGISIYVWVGKTATKEEKKLAWKHLDQYIAQEKRPKHIPVCKVNEGKEPKHFLSTMKMCKDGKWNAKSIDQGFCGRKSSRKVANDKK